MTVVRLLLLVVAVIHFLPVTGVLGPARLSALYGLTFEDPSLRILMQHRAVLFGILGGLLAFAAFRPALQPLAIVVGLVSTVSFVAIAWGVGGYGEAIRKVVVVDLIAIACLVGAIVARTLSAGSGN